MKKYLTGLEELKIHYPNLVYEEGQLVNAEVVVEPAGDELICEHFAGHMVWDNDGSNNPENDFERVAESGAEYVELVHNGNYEDAFNSV